MRIQSVHRALDILSLFSHRRQRLGVTEMSRFLSLPKGTVHGLVATLVDRGFLHQDPETKKYHLGLKIYELGVILAGTLEINRKAGQPLHRLSKRSRLVARVAIWDGDSALITLTVHPRSQALLFPQIGPRVPAYCSAIGRAIVAFLEPQELKGYLDQLKIISYTPTTPTQKGELVTEIEETRRRGYAIDREETVVGMACIGAPIFERDGAVAASVSISGEPTRVLGERTEELAHFLTKTSAEISREMGYFPEALEAGIT